MELHTEHIVCNAIDLVDQDGNEVGTVHGPQEGDHDVTDHELEIAELICKTFNDSIESIEL